MKKRIKIYYTTEDAGTNWKIIALDEAVDIQRVEFEEIKTGNMKILE